MTTIADGPAAVPSALQRARDLGRDTLRNQAQDPGTTVDPDTLARLARQTSGIGASGPQAGPGHAPDIETARAAADLPALKPGQAHDGGSRGAAATRNNPGNGKSAQRPGVGD